MIRPGRAGHRRASGGLQRSVSVRKSGLHQPQTRPDPVVLQRLITLASELPQLKSPTEANQNQFPPGTNPPQPFRACPAKRQALPETEFEQMVADSAGRPYRCSGNRCSSNLQAPLPHWICCRFPDDYIIGPGDELQIMIWGQLEANLHVKVDRVRADLYSPSRTNLGRGCPLRRTGQYL